jgi:hypothetical protein
MPLNNGNMGIPGIHSEPDFVPSGSIVVETKKEEKKIDNGQMRMF